MIPNNYYNDSGKLSDSVNKPSNEAVIYICPVLELVECTSYRSPFTPDLGNIDDSSCWRIEAILWNHIELTIQVVLFQRTSRPAGQQNLACASFGSYCACFGSRLENY